MNNVLGVKLSDNDNLYNVPQYETTLNIHYLNSIIDKLSINNLINILKKNGVSVNDIRLISQLSTASIGSTILGIYRKNNLIYIKINIFKIDVFSELENCRDHYINEEYNHLLITLEYVLNNLSSLYVLGVEKLLSLLKYDLNSLTNKSKMICFINAINQELCEDYPSTIVNCVRKMCRFPCKPNIVGKSFINDIYLGSFVMLDSYIIEIELFLMSSKNNNMHLGIIRSKIMKLAIKMNIGHYELKFLCSFHDKTPKNYLLYIGSYTL